MTVAGHLLFGLLADGFWSAMAARALTGAGWAGTYMTGLKFLADRVEGKLMSRATAGHAASIGVSGALSFAFADVIANVGGGRERNPGLAARRLGSAGSRSIQAIDRQRSRALRFQAGAAESLRHGVRH